jgi:anaphase-promoting complex subunit 1
MSICLPSSQSLKLFSLAPGDDNMLKASPLKELSAISAAPLRMTRENVWDLLLVKPDHHLAILTHGTHELPIEIHDPDVTMEKVSHVEDEPLLPVNHGGVKAVQGGWKSTVTLEFEDGWKGLTTIDLVPQDMLTTQCLQILALTLPTELMFSLHQLFLQKWSSRHLMTSDGIEFESFKDALYEAFSLSNEKPQPINDYWTRLGRSVSHDRFREDPALKGLRLPPNPPRLHAQEKSSKPHKLLAAVLYALHTLGEDLRLMIHHYQLLTKLAPVICKIALTIRPEWADYWRRLCPDAIEGWSSSQTACKSSVLFPSHYLIDLQPSDRRL